MISSSPFHMRMLLRCRATQSSRAPPEAGEARARPYARRRDGFARNIFTVYADNAFADVHCQVADPFEIIGNANNADDFAKIDRNELPRSDGRQWPPDRSRAAMHRAPASADMTRLPRIGMPYGRCLDRFDDRFSVRPPISAIMPVSCLRSASKAIAACSSLRSTLWSLMGQPALASDPIGAGWWSRPRPLHRQPVSAIRRDKYLHVIGAMRTRHDVALLEALAGLTTQQHLQFG